MCIGSNWAMRKDVFEEIGAFDEHMKAWGGENIDLALRVRPTLGLFGVGSVSFRFGDAVVACSAFLVHMLDIWSGGDIENTGIIRNGFP